MTNEEALADIKAKVKELLQQFVDSSDVYVDKLAQCGIIYDHTCNSSNYRVPEKIVCALAAELEFKFRSNRRGDLIDVKNYQYFL